MQMSEGDNIFTYIGKLQEIDDELSSIGKRNFDPNIFMTLLRSLLKSYCTLVKTLEIRPPTKLTLQMVTT